MCWYEIVQSIAKKGSVKKGSRKDISNFSEKFVFSINPQNILVWVNHSHPATVSSELTKNSSLMHAFHYNPLGRNKKCFYIFYQFIYISFCLFIFFTQTLSNIYIYFFLSIPALSVFMAASSSSEASNPFKSAIAIYY